MMLTVALSTWNRAGLLRKTLEQLTEIEPPTCGWELVVVNNNSTDQTDEVIADFVTRLPLRRVFEPNQGLSNARNAAVRVANGDYVVFMDDDVLVDRHWLAAYEEAIAKHPDAVVFGGPVRPWFEGTPPAWLTESLDQIGFVFGARDDGDEEGAIGGRFHLPLGANHVVRLAELRRHPYDTTLGKVGSGGMLGEETSMLSRILAEPGATGRWVPRASLHHWIPREHQTLRYVWRYYYLWGRTLSAKQQGQQPRLLFGRPMWLYREIVSAYAAFCFKRTFRGSREWVEAWARCGTAAGALSVDLGSWRG